MSNFIIGDDGYLWGFSHFELSDNTKRNKFEKVPIEEMFFMISTGSHRTIKIDENGFLWDYSADYHRKLGMGDYTDKNKFEKVPIKVKFAIVAEKIIQSKFMKIVIYGVVVPIDLDN